MHSGQQAVKRIMDVTVAATALAGSAWALTLIGLAIKLDSRGPALYRQVRLGRDARPFTMLKFRTMRTSATVEIGQDGMVRNEGGDARHTRVGRLLRRTSLDELPQLWNVLVGEMSLVGPRPDLPEALPFYDRWQRDRFRVRPGITGLAQVSGRNKMTPGERWNLDAQYATRWRFMDDLRILVATGLAVVSANGVYETRPRSTK